MKAAHVVSFALVIIGAVNWGLVGLFNLNVVNAILSFSPGLEKLVYVLVGLGGLLLAFTHKNDCKACGTK